MTNDESDTERFFGFTEDPSGQISESENLFIGEITIKSLDGVTATICLKEHGVERTVVDAGLMLTFNGFDEDCRKNTTLKYGEEGGPKIIGHWIGVPGWMLLRDIANTPKEKLGDIVKEAKHKIVNNLPISDEDKIRYAAAYAMLNKVLKSGVSEDKALSMGIYKSMEDRGDDFIAQGILLALSAESFKCDCLMCTGLRVMGLNEKLVNKVQAVHSRLFNIMSRVVCSWRATIDTGIGESWNSSNFTEKDKDIFNEKYELYSQILSTKMTGKENVKEVMKELNKKTGE